jgi:hypothetical protein
MHVQPLSQVQLIIFISLYIYISSYFTLPHVLAGRHHQIHCFLARIAALYYFLPYYARSDVLY